MIKRTSVCLTNEINFGAYLLQMRNDHYYMEICLTLSEQAAEKGNTAVGAVVVKDDEIVSEAEEAASTKKDITCHAELEAIRIAVHKLGTINLSGCILYSTHEPCVMCSYAIRFYKIKKVVYLHKANYLGGVSSPLPLLVTNEIPPHWSNAPVIVQLEM
jgi:tRNA(adenine34) deaminase